MSLALVVVTAVRFEGRSKSEVARDYRVSRRWVQRICQRYEAEGGAGLEPRSRYESARWLIANTPSGKGKGVLEIRYKDADRLRGDYSLFLQVQELPS
jgi:hypothetical protein